MTTEKSMRLLTVSTLILTLASITTRPARAGAQPKPAPVENVSSFEPRTPDEERRALHVPEGFEVQLVAADPDIRKPMNIAFDDRGRLWVTETVEYPFPAPEGQKPRDAVKILEDFGPDGRARTITTFADGLNIPIGILPLPSARGALVYSIPAIDRMLDTDGDGRADVREPVYRTFGSKDTHGMTGSFTWGFDGWVYACHGFSNTSHVEGADKDEITMQSGNIYRMRPDGSHAEYYTHGQVNPFGLSFDPMGNLYSSDCHSKPIYLLLRGAYYPSFGKPDDGLGFGPAMMTHDHGSTAIDGATYYAADHFPAAYRGTIFVGNVVTNRINHDRLEWHGSSPQAITQPDFVWSEDNWFRPVDIELGPDGALYVADFYNRIIGHYEVPLTHPGRDRERGRIWRIVYRGPGGKGRAVAPRADWTTAAVGELVKDLGHANLAVRIKAANQLVARGEPAVAAVRAALGSAEMPWQRVHGLWVLHRLGALDDEALGASACDPDPAVRVHAMRIIGERARPSSTLRDRAGAGLDDDDPLVRRQAAEALGRHPDPSCIRPLLALRQEAPADDTHLVHAARMALRDQLRLTSSWEHLASLELSERDRGDVADVACGVPSAEAARFLMGYIETVAEPPKDLARYVHHVARHGADDTRGPLLAFVLGRGDDRPQRAALLKAIQQGTQERGAKLGDDVRAAALDLSLALLDSSKGDEVALGIGLTNSFRLREATGRLEAIAGDRRAPEPRRGEAIAALVTLDPKGAIGPLGRVLGNSGEPVALRERAAQALAGIDQPEARAALLGALPAAPERLQGAIAAGLAQRKAGAEALLDAVAAGKASARLLQERRVALSLGNAGMADLSERLAALLKGLPPADERTGELLRRRRAGFAAAKGDPGRGARVFEATCASCHQVGERGARVGPQLDGVGTRGADRLIEDILDPNRNVDQAFRATTLALADGRVVSGLLLREEGAVLVLADAQGKEVRVPTDQVEERTTSPLSPMPANLAEQVAEPDFYDLLAFLLAQQQAKD
jgi:putative heme-binding domain-containing protein